MRVVASLEKHISAAAKAAFDFEGFNGAAEAAPFQNFKHNLPQCGATGVVVTSC
jgi:hypothetical protein